MRNVVIICSLVTLFGAALLEMLCIVKSLRAARVAGVMMAVALGALGIRLVYLIAMDDTARLSIWGTLPIFLIAFSRVLACSAFLRKAL